MFDLKRRESLRCLHASLASLSVLDWSIERKDLMGQVAVEAEQNGIEDKLINLRAILLAPSVSREDAVKKYLLMGSQLVHHIRSSLLADAVRWWAAAHRSRQDEKKYLRDSMYVDEGFPELFGHFYHGFRNNQLAHFPGGVDFDNMFITPLPYLLPTQADLDDFKRLLAYSFELLMVDEADRKQFSNSTLLQQLAEIGIPEEDREAAMALLRQAIDEQRQKLLAVPMRDYFKRPKTVNESGDPP